MWRRKYAMDGNKSKFASLEEENKALRLENAILIIERDMLKKTTRLSRDDGEDSVSNSIKTQRAMLEDYAERNGLVPFLHIQDDGYSGTNWSSPGWQ